jgi:putative hemolysin
MKKFLWILFIIIILAGGGFLYYYLTINPNTTTNMANPASVYCEQNGGTIEIVQVNS